MNEIEFKKINHEILSFVSGLEIDAYGLHDENHKLPLSDAIFCIQDIKRNYLFYESISKVLQNGGLNQIVLDVGCGTGVLGVYSLALGAKKCIFVEENPYTMQVAKKMVNHFGLTDKSEFILGDASLVDLDHGYDLLISETLESTLGIEDFPLIINNLLKFANRGAVIIPKGFELNISELDLDGNILFVHNYKYESLRGFNRSKIKLTTKDTKQLKFDMKICFDDDLVFNSGDFGGFINSKVYNLDGFRHILFDFIY